jgi:hypothetical protein
MTYEWNERTVVPAHGRMRVDESDHHSWCRSSCFVVRTDARRTCNLWFCVRVLSLETAGTVSPVSLSGSPPVLPPGPRKPCSSSISNAKGMGTPAWSTNRNTGYLAGSSGRKNRRWSVGHGGGVNADRSRVQAGKEHEDCWNIRSRSDPGLKRVFRWL